MINIAKETILDGQAVLINVKGTLNDVNSVQLEDYCLNLIQNGVRNLLLNASNIRFISSSGIGLAVSLMKKIKEKDGLFIIFNLNNTIRSLFAVLGIEEAFTLAVSQKEAEFMMESFLEQQQFGGIPVKTYKEPLLIECDNCSASIRVKGPGDYICPDCQNRFYATGDMNIIFK